MNLAISSLAAQDTGPLTIAEKSEFKSTSKSAEVVEFVDWCANHSQHVNKFVCGKTVEGRDMVGVTISKEKYDLGDKDDRARVLVIGNIHSGECAGKEALLMLLRELSLDPSKNNWLDHIVIVMVPNYSADSNDRMGLNNRPGQIGPENGMGRRENAQGLDLNRDFVKLDSPEARALVGLMDKVDPQIFIDCHTTNGSKHQYALTYDVPHNPACPEPIRDYLRLKLMPEVTSRLETEGTLTFYYGNFNRDQTQWTTYGYEPRYSTEYAGLRGRMGILSEAYSYISYRERIFATKQFVSTILDYVSEDWQTIVKLVQTVDDDLIAAARQEPQRVAISLAAKVISFDEKCAIKGFQDDQPCDYLCEFVGKYESTRQSPLPFAYLIPADQVRVVDRLLMHGVKVNRLTKDIELEVEVDTVKDLDRAQRAFQEHNMVRVAANRGVDSRAIKKGEFVVQTAQPLGRLISYLLEAESSDGFAYWNFFDEQLKVGAEYPVLRVAAPVAMELEDVTKVEPAVPLSLDLIDGPNSLLANQPEPPHWQGKTNQLETKSWGRSLLVDAESQSFTGIVAAPFPKQQLVDLFVAGGIETGIAEGLADAEPEISDDRQTAVLTHEQYTVIVHGDKSGDAEAVNARFTLIGTPADPAELIHLNHDESVVAYSTNGALNFFNLRDWKPASIKSDSDSSLVGKLDWVYQEELYGRGNFKGYWLSPTGPAVAYLKLDESPVYPFTVVDHLPVRGKSEVTSYPKAGDPLPKVKLAVANTLDATGHDVDLSAYDGTEILISGVSWTNDGNQVLLQIQNREQTWLDLLAIDSNGDNPRKLFRDETPAWIESPGDPVFLADGSFIWPSPRTGYMHLYHYRSDGELIGALTSGAWEVRSLVGIDPAKEFVYFTATRESPLDVQCYRIRLADNSLEQLTRASGTHDVDFSHDYSYFIDNFSTVTEPPRSRLYRSDGTFLRDLNAPVDDRINYVTMSKPEFLTIPSGNEQPLDAMIIRPPNFDPAKKYPVLINIYAGPQAPRVRNRFAGDWYLWHQFLAQQGYVIWMCDNQSASYRSVKHAWPIHRNFAENELADIERGVAWLKQQPWIDGDRIGIWGWSYGGYMTAYALTHSHSFKVGISGAPVTDWKNYDAIYTERYMDLPQNNTAGYEKAAVLPSASELAGKLLLIHGSTDDNVHLNNSMQLIYELQKAGQQFELMIYPQSRHAVRDKEQLAHLRKLMTDFVIENL
jgi:dipeptidyl aminopeptidase/acylaminoacyl peptidase